jgi:hypothetical protein
MHQELQRQDLPEPGPPRSSVVRLRGKPPPVISSRPAMPVGALAGDFPARNWMDCILVTFS